MKPYRVDEIGEQILEILRKDSKVDSDEIARQINSTADKVKKYVKKFEEDRIILGYHTSINWQRIRLNEVKALIEVKVIPERKVGFDSVAEAIYRFPEVSSVFLLSGGYDLLVQVEGENLREVAQFVSEKLATIQGVQSTVSHFLLKKYKEEGVILADQSESKRLPVTP
ncbi:MAG: AsnC family transcriptional regulator [Spirochaetes bacterium RBG_16_49_21]|nr:MAG: AsnC family transcriptional regulator [Spirochaetes bacterium RBG_16_49_21]